MKLHDELSARKKELTKFRRKVERSMRGTPEGSLRISHNGDRVLYYWRKGASDRRGTYIAKTDLKIAMDLAQKTYLDAALKSIDKEL